MLLIPLAEELGTILRIHAPPPYMYHAKRHATSYGADYSLEFEVAESIQKKRKRGAVGLDQDEALYDLERMGVSLRFASRQGDVGSAADRGSAFFKLRDPYRGTYPPHFAVDPAYGYVGGAGKSGASATGGSGSYVYENGHQVSQQSQHPQQHPLAAQGRTVASVPQQGQSGRPDPFSAYRVREQQLQLQQQQAQAQAKAQMAQQQQHQHQSLQPGVSGPYPGSTAAQQQLLLGHHQPHPHQQQIPQHQQHGASVPYGKGAPAQAHGPRPTLDDHLGHAHAAGPAIPPAARSASLAAGAHAGRFMPHHGI